MKKPTNATWQVKQMMEYAIIKYGLTDGYADSPNSQRSNYERKVRRTLEDRGLVVKDKNTDKYIYVLPEKEAKYFIDVFLRSYFEERTGESQMKSKFAKKDAALNESNYKAVIESTEDYNDHEKGDPDPTPINEELEASIDRFMLRAIFAKFYSFDDEAQYRKDYISLPHYKNDDILEPYIEGYSFLNERLSNPVKYYCVEK